VQSESKAGIALVADKSDPTAGDFQSSANKVVSLMPDSYTVNRFDVDTLGTSGTHSGVADALRQGSGIMHYVGHSSLIALGRDSSLLTASEIESMSDTGSPMLMVSMACSTASFGYPAMNSIGESAVLKAGGAAVGFFGATGLSRNYLADIMAEGFYLGLFDPANSRVGDAVVQAKRYSSEQGAKHFALDIYNLLGDPAMLAPVQ
ncbi:MAG: C25 family cysteine peptidase, partial [Candidatus Electrothrix sp.]